jgi:hypothetical protein
MPKGKRPKAAWLAATLLGGIIGGIVPGSASAAGTGTPPGTVVQNGTTWYTVSNALQLEYIDQHQSKYLNQKIELTADITLPAPAQGQANWVPFGEGTPFTGVFDGGGHTISGVVVNDVSDADAGFFGVLAGTVSQLGLVNATISGKSADMGVLAGTLQGTVSESFVTGQISGAVDGGGFAGVIDGGSLTNCYSDVSVDAAADSGGLVGLFTVGSLTDCYAVGPVGGSPSGGLVGSMSLTTPPVATLTADFFDETTTEQGHGVGDNPTAAGATGEPTSAMKEESTYTGWDFQDTWGLSNTFNNGYPYLRWQALPPPAGQLPEVPTAAVLPLLAIGGGWAIRRHARQPAR